MTSAPTQPHLVEGTASENNDMPFPSLFTLELPPCGLEIQVAYFNLVTRLRDIWVRHVTFDSKLNTSTADVYMICKDMRMILRAEAMHHPPGSQEKTGARQPWRRETVFQCEMYWIRYFVREAEIMKDFPRMSEKRQEAIKAQMKKTLVPKELGLKPEKDMNHDVKKMWIQWQDGKRGWLLKHEKAIEELHRGGLNV